MLSLSETAVMSMTGVVRAVRHAGQYDDTLVPVTTRPSPPALRRRRVAAPSPWPPASCWRCVAAALADVPERLAGPAGRPDARRAVLYVFAPLAALRADRAARSYRPAWPAASAPASGRRRERPVVRRSPPRPRRAPSAGSAGTNRGGWGQWQLVSFSAAQRYEIDRAIRAAEQSSRYEFSVFVGTAEGETRAPTRAACTARSWSPTAACWCSSTRSPRVIEVVTGAEVRRTLSDAEVELAVLQMQCAFAAGDLLGGLKRGINMLAEHARAPQTLHAQE